MHKHYCPLGRHIWEPAKAVDSYGLDGVEGCAACAVVGWIKAELACPECDKESVKVSWFIVPVICERCKTQKRDATGRGLFVSNAWLKGRRMVCPPCHEAEKTMAALETIVTWDEVDDDDVPF